MGECSIPPEVYAAEAAGDARRGAQMAHTQMDLLLMLLIKKGLITDKEANQIRYCPR